MNVTSLFSNSALSRMRVADDGGSGAIGGSMVRPAPMASVRPVGESGTGTDGLRAVTGNRIPAPSEGGRIERPQNLAADRMEQVQADLPQDEALSGVMAMLIKFSEAQGMTR
jgi:hypothetical protein